MSRLTIEVPLRWGDMDAFGHVNNATIVQLLEQARVEGFYSDRDVSGVVIARHEIEYLAPMPYTREPVRVELWLSRIGGSSIDVCYEIHSPAAADHDTVYVRAATVVVFLDESLTTPRRITDEERAEWAQLVEEPVRFRR